MIKDQYTEVKDFLTKKQYVSQKEMETNYFLSSDKNFHKIVKSRQSEKCAGPKQQIIKLYTIIKISYLPIFICLCSAIPIISI